MKIHTLAWIAWITAGLIIVSTTRNPFYLVIFDLILLLLLIRLGSNLRLLIRFSISMIALSTILNMFISPFGNTVLFTLPGNIPLVNDRFTLEAVVFGLINGLVLVGIFNLFSVLSHVIAVRALVRLFPRVFQPVSVITTIALTFIPATKKQFESIREAQSIRGHQVKGLRDWLPLLLPLLIGGLERAIHIAESMTARGFNNQVNPSLISKQRYLLLVGLSLMVAGWFWQLIGLPGPISIVLIFVGVFTIVGILFVSPKKLTLSRYQTETWSPRSLLHLVMSLSIGIVYILPFPGHTSIYYDPYPQMSSPPFSFLPALFCVFILFPLFTTYRGYDDQDQ